jgi:uncharacterized YccA/Bax inhibitor family protein
LACLEVFALGTELPAETGRESGYFAVQAGLAQSVSKSARYLLKPGFVNETAPVLVLLVSQIAARFGVVVTEKLAARAVPVIGAVGGAAINAPSLTIFKAWRAATSLSGDLSASTGLTSCDSNSNGYGYIKQPAAS